MNEPVPEKPTAGVAEESMPPEEKHTSASPKQAMLMIPGYMISDSFQVPGMVMVLERCRRALLCYLWRYGVQPRFLDSPEWWTGSRAICRTLDIRGQRRQYAPIQQSAACLSRRVKQVPMAALEQDHAKVGMTAPRMFLWLRPRSVRKPTAKKCHGHKHVDIYIYMRSRNLCHHICQCVSAFSVFL